MASGEGGDLLTLVWIMACYLRATVITLTNVDLPSMRSSDIHSRFVFSLHEYSKYQSQGPCLKLRTRQNGRHFADDTFKYIFLNENV